MKFIPLLRILVLYNVSKFCNLSLKHREITENRRRQRRRGGRVTANQAQRKKEG